MHNVYVRGSHGYWLKDGNYTEPLSWCMIDEKWVDWQPFRLLPAPAHV